MSRNALSSHADGGFCHTRQAGITGRARVTIDAANQGESEREIVVFVFQRAGEVIEVVSARSRRRRSLGT